MLEGGHYPLYPTCSNGSLSENRLPWRRHKSSWTGQWAGRGRTLGMFSGWTGGGPVAPSSALMSPGHTGPRSWLMNSQTCCTCCVLRTPGPYIHQAIWVNCFPNDKLVIPTPPTVWSTIITELSCILNFVLKFPPLVCWSNYFYMCVHEHHLFYYDSFNMGLKIWFFIYIFDGI